MTKTAELVTIIAGLAALFGVTFRLPKIVAFFAQFFPKLRLETTVGYSQNNGPCAARFFIKMKNPSVKVVISIDRVMVRIADPTVHRLLRRTKWHEYRPDLETYGTFDSIPPKNDSSVAFPKHGIIKDKFEEFLCQWSKAAIIEPILMHGTPRWFFGAYRLHRDTPLHIQLTVHYRYGWFRYLKRTARRAYAFKPVGELRYIELSEGSMGQRPVLAKWEAISEVGLRYRW